MNFYEQPIYPPCPNGYLVPCKCPDCVVETDRLDDAKAAACAAQSTTEYTRLGESADDLRTFLKDCRCPCCEARARLAALSCPAPDQRDDNPNPARTEAERRFIACLVQEFRDALAIGLKAIRPAAEVSSQPEDSGA